MRSSGGVSIITEGCCFFFKPKATPSHALKSSWKNDATAEIQWPDSTSRITCQ